MATQDEQQSLPLVAADLTVLHIWMARTAVTFFLFGVHVTLTLTVVLLFYLRSLKSNAHIALVITAIAMLIVSLATLLLDLEYTLVQIPSIGFTPPDPDILARLMTNMTIASSFMTRFNFLASDAIVVWRAWVLFPRSLAVKITLILCIIGSTAGVLVDAGRGAVFALRDSSSSSQNPGPAVNGLVMSLPLLVTNLLATLLIGYKANLHRQDMKKNLSSCSGSVVQVQKVLLLLVESGVAYCILFTCYAVSSFVGGDEKQSSSFEIFGVAMPLLSGMYPITIILIVTLESKKNELQSHEMSLTQSIKFAAAPASSNSDTIVSGFDI
ncbi:hypothetical protein D9758_010578 [Tetrapyrgos nigripes]|uniref:Uncharacterized protein n=1 Tax=Tetrapyrgos nigripes TaxID=182062 RepID=A0A8H5D629_9AGAR|nr:hypothetical protein D9758_010578 [Tetrapyrgos nigripes]